MRGKVLSIISIVIGAFALISTAIYFIAGKIFMQDDILIDDAPLTFGLGAAVVFLFMAIILTVVGIIYTLIILPFCIKDKKVRLWLVGFLLNLVSVILNVIPAIYLGFALFIYYCLMKIF